MVFDTAQAFVAGFVGLAIIVVVGGILVGELADIPASGTPAANMTSLVQDGLEETVANAPTWGKIAGIVVLVLIVSLIGLGGFAAGRKKGYF